MEKGLRNAEQIKYRQRSDGQVIIGQEPFQVYHSLPLDVEVTEEIADKFGFDIVINVPEPEHDPVYQYTSWDDFEEIDGKWYMKWEILDKREEEAKDPNYASDIIAERNRRLYLTDWWALPENADSYTEERKKYRQGLRDITKQPRYPFAVDWPEYTINVDSYQNPSMEDSAF